MSWSRTLGSAVTAGAFMFAIGIAGGGVLGSGLADGVIPNVPAISQALGVSERRQAKREERRQAEEIAQREREEEQRQRVLEAQAASNQGGEEDAEEEEEKEETKTASPTPKPKPKPRPSPTKPGCGSGAMSSAPTNGTRVEVIKLSTEDAYYATRSSYIGKVGTASGMSVTDGCYLGGSVTWDDGSSAYFYKVAVKRSSRAAPEPTTSDDCPAGAYTSVSSGSRYKILKIHSEDAYYSSKASIEGKSGTNTGLSKQSGCWWSGSFVQDDGTEMYFYKAALGKAVAIAPTPTPSSSSSGCPSGAVTSIRAGDRLEIAAIHSSDAYYSSRSDMIGKTGKAEAMTKTDGCWFAGPFTQDDGESRYFYMAAFTRASGASSASASSTGCPSGAVSSVSSGDRVRVLKVHSDDAYYATRGTYEGKTGTVVSMHKQDGCYFSGEMTMSDGGEPYFYKVAMQRL